MVWPWRARSREQSSREGWEGLNLALPLSNGLFKSARETRTTFSSSQPLKQRQQNFHRQAISHSRPTMATQHLFECKRSNIERWMPGAERLTAWSVDFFEWGTGSSRWSDLSPPITCATREGHLQSISLSRFPTLLKFTQGIPAWRIYPCTLLFGTCSMVTIFGYKRNQRGSYPSPQLSHFGQVNLTSAKEVHHPYEQWSHQFSLGSNKAGAKVRNVFLATKVSQALLLLVSKPNPEPPGIIEACSGIH